MNGEQEDEKLFLIRPSSFCTPSPCTSVRSLAPADYPRNGYCLPSIPGFLAFKFISSPRCSLQVCASQKERRVCDFTAWA
jgi:hypothetical protein